MEYSHSRFPKTSEDLVRDLVYANNGFHLPKEVIFGTPTHYTPLEDDPKQNDTSVEVSMPEGHWRWDMGHRWLHYRRLFLNALLKRPNQQILVTAFPISLYDLLPQINAYYGINLATSDVLDVIYVSRAETPMTLVANPDSLAWQAQVVLPITYPLSMVLTNTDLAGFDSAD